jgi:signal transduction histidine kinase
LEEVSVKKQSEDELREKLEVTQAALDFERQITGLLHEFSVSANAARDEAGTYKKSLEVVCRGLGWDLGHVILVANSADLSVDTSSHSFVSDPHRFGPLRELLAGRQRIPPGSIAFEAATAGHVVWEEDLFRREPSIRGLIPGAVTLGGIALPVIVAGNVVAVLEFYTERVFGRFENLERFFHLFAHEIGGVLEIREHARRENEHFLELLKVSRMATLGEVTAGVAHEIRDPLSAISLTCQVLKKLVKDVPLDAELVDLQIARIEVSLSRLNSIVADLKHFSRDSSKDPLVVMPVRELIREAESLSSAKYLREQIHLHVAQVSEAVSVECRSSQILQVLLNLLNNAFDAVRELEERWVKIDVTERGELIDIVVSDSGGPIPPQVAEKLMTPFFTTKPPGKGLGLGLSISRSLAKVHNGALLLDSTAARTRFVLSLPRKQPPACATEDANDITQPAGSETPSES